MALTATTGYVAVIYTKSGGTSPTIKYSGTGITNCAVAGEITYPMTAVHADCALNTDTNGSAAAGDDRI